MARELKVYRNAITDLVLRNLGALKYCPRLMQGSRFSSLFSNEILQLNAIPQTPLQNWDSSSETYGQFYFVAGYDPWEDF